MQQKVFKIIICFLGLLFSASSINAGVTGKLKGKVFDSESSMPLPGANVILVGKQFGAAADVNGEFIIIGISPGIYSVKASMIGYKDIIVSDVSIMTDLTTALEIQMYEESLALNEDIIVIAEKPVIQKDVTASIQNINVAQLERLPIKDAKKTLMVQTGVFFDPTPVMGGLGSAGKGESRYSVRGGSQEEVLWYMDGARTASLLWGRADWAGSFTNINLNIIQEIQIMTGGYTAEYGNAQSGIVSIVTKEGSDQFHGSLEYIHGFSGQHHFGNYLYDKSTQKEFIDNTLPDGTLDPNWWTPQRQSQIYDYTDIPDQTINFDFGGPLLNWDGTNVHFFTAGTIKKEAYSLPRPRDAKGNENVFFNLSQNRESAKWKLSGFYNHVAHTTLQENGDFTSQSKYYRGWGSLTDVYNYNLAFNYTHVLNTQLFYELKLSTYWAQFKEEPSEYFVLGESVNPTIWGFQRFDGYESEPFDAYTPALYNNTVSGDVSFSGHVNWQFDKNNMLKSGIEFIYNTYDEKENYRLPSFTGDKNNWINRGLMESYHPLQFAFYIQDKMEFETMILNIGLRYDRFDPNYDWFKETNLFNLALDPLFDPALDPDNDQIDANGRIKYSFENVLNQPREAAKSYDMISPRFGVSFPVTENTLLHFNYGHYFQLPPLDQMFEFAYFRPIYIVKNIIAEEELADQEGREPAHIPSTDGDAERIVAYTNKPLKPQKTIQFEAGVKHNFEDIGVLEITAFYKDVFDQTSERVGLFDHSIYGYDPIQDRTTPNVSYQTFISGDYGDSRGFEITFKTAFSKNIALDVNYSFSKSTQGRATPRVVRIDKNGNETLEWDVDVNKRIPVENNYSRPHVVRANLFLAYPETESDDFLSTIFKGTSASLLYRFVSGQAFTYLLPDDAPDTYNNYRFPAIQTVDFLIEKKVSLFNSHNLSFYMQITNLFNTKNLRSYGDILFDSEATKKFVETEEVTTVDAAGYDISWQTYYETRRFYFGVKYSF